MTGKQIKETNYDKSERRKQHRSVRHSIKEVGSECIKIQAIRRPNQGSRKRTKLRGYTRQAAGGGIHRRNGTSMSIAAATEVMNIDEYLQNVITFLSDNKMYEKLKKDPTQKYKKPLVSIIRTQTEELHKYLYPTVENVPRIHCTKNNP